MRYLNLGCGRRCHPQWINIDITPSQQDVISHDLSQGIPLADACCDVVYHSHFLEHLRPSAAAHFMGECYRVMKPRGILRVAVPDIERICRKYLEKLEQARKHNGHSDDYDWILLELLDQSVRELDGGGMVDYLSRSSIPNEEFIYERIGEEGRDIVRLLKEQSITQSDPSLDRTKAPRRLSSIPFLQFAKSKLRAALLTLAWPRLAACPPDWSLSSRWRSAPLDV
jgi:SAM-dependent methyltransferase